jgi:HlyD family secretion protein
MTTTTQEPPVKAPQQAAVNEQFAKNGAPPSPASTRAAGGVGGTHRRRKPPKWLVVLTLLLLVAGTGFAWAEYTGIDLRATLADAWHRLTGNDVPKGFAFTNGRLEATKVYITTKYQGRIETVLVREGDTIHAGQVLARMDTRTLKAQLRQAEAQIQRAKDAKATAVATVAQRKAELAFWRSDVERQRTLVTTRATSRTEYEGVYAKWKAGEATLLAAKSQVTEAQAAIEAARAEADRLRVEIDESILVAPRRGRVQYRLAEPGEVLSPGGRVLDTIDLTDVYMLFFLPEAEAGKAVIGAEARLVFDSLPDVVIPATVYFVAAEAQFTPKAVETRTERQKLAFQVRARIDPALLRKYEAYVRTGLPGVIYVRLDPIAQWPERLHVKGPEAKGAKR